MKRTKKTKKQKKFQTQSKYSTKNILKTESEIDTEKDTQISETDTDEEKELIELETTAKLPTFQIATDAIKQYIKKIGQINTNISREEMHELWKRVKKGDRRAKEKILEINLKLVIPIAKKYVYPGADLMDLIEEGNLGLLHAIDKFDPKKGYRFSTYASYWIEQYIRRAVEEQSKTIRIPPHAWTALRKWLRQWDILHAKLGRDPTLTEMAREMHWNANQIRTVLNAYEIIKGSTSLENPIYNEEKCYSSNSNRICWVKIEIKKNKC
jgi:RNA polymerase sigma factor (sigma-70 family)